MKWSMYFRVFNEKGEMINKDHLEGINKEQIAALVNARMGQIRTEHKVSKVLFEFIPYHEA